MKPNHRSVVDVLLFCQQATRHIWTSTTTRLAGDFRVKFLIFVDFHRLTPPRESRDDTPRFNEKCQFHFPSNRSGAINISRNPPNSDSIVSLRDFYANLRAFWQETTAVCGANVKTINLCASICTRHVSGASHFCSCKVVKYRAYGKPNKFRKVICDDSASSPKKAEKENFLSSIYIR